MTTMPARKKESRPSEAALHFQPHPGQMETKIPAASSLLAEPQFRRLLKFQMRRREGLGSSELEIRTETFKIFIVADDPRLWFTVYRMRLRSAEDVPHRDSRSSDAGGRWMLKKRYSQCELFRRLHLKRIEAWEAAVRREYAAMKAPADARKTFALVSNSMRRAISPSFPKKHMRGDTPAIIRERVLGLPHFIRKLVAVYSDLTVHMASRLLNLSDHSASWTLLSTIMTKLEAFLEIPQLQKDAETRRKSAVLALQDVDALPELAEGEGEQQLCAICLNEDAAAEEDPPLVRLPCSHHFHEDCVIDWFSANISCPLCRRTTFQ